MTFKVIRGQGQGQEMTSVPYQDYFYTCCLWPCLSPLMALWYVMYFQFCGWHHVSVIALQHVTCIPKQQCNMTSIKSKIQTKFCQTVKTSKFLLWVMHCDKVCYLWFPVVNALVTTVSIGYATCVWLLIQVKGMGMDSPELWYVIARTGERYENGLT